MNLTEGVYHLSEQLLERDSYVWLNYEGIEEVAEAIKKTPLNFDYNKPKTKEEENKNCIIELVANSINYCFWYARSNFRFNGATSRTMYDCIEDAFKFYQPFPDTTEEFKDCLNNLILSLSINRYPLLEERIKHLKELIYNGEDYCDGLISGVRHNYNNFDVQSLMKSIISNFPSYASDLFLKRASLFFIQLYRRNGWFKEDMMKLHVPADYQVPKKLHFFNCIKYSQELEAQINSNKLIPKHSLEECQIRAATVLACKKLVELTGINIADIDAWFWLQRDLCDDPFHLTITTDY